MLSIITKNSTISLSKCGEAEICDMPKVLPNLQYLKRMRERSRRATVWFGHRMVLFLVLTVMLTVLGQLWRWKANNMQSKSSTMPIESKNVTCFDENKQEIVFSGITRLRLLSFLIIDTVCRSGLGIYYLLALMVFALTLYDDRFWFIYCPKVTIRQPALAFDREQTWNEIKVSIGIQQIVQ